MQHCKLYQLEQLSLSLSINSQAPQEHEPCPMMLIHPFDLTWYTFLALSDTLGPFIRGKIDTSHSIRRVLNKAQSIPYKRHIKTRLSKDASYRRTGVRGCS